MEGDSLWPHQSELDTRHSRISEAAYRLAEARGLKVIGVDDWLAAEHELDEADQDGLMQTTPAGSSSEASDSTTPGRAKEIASRQQTRPEQDSQTGSSELDEVATRRNANVAVPARPADAK